MASQSAAPAEAATHPRILVVDDEPGLIELIDELVCRKIDGRMIVANSIGQARQVLATQSIELMVTDVHLPDGDGMELLPALQAQQPGASAIVITGKPTIDGAIAALRHGAFDFLPKPFTADHLTERVQRALQRQALVARTEKRLGRLRDAVRRLNESRKLVSRKVDLLCNDLVSAYGELSKQLDSVRTHESFRSILNEARDLEQLLCHAMDWMLRQLGYSNIALWLSTEDNDFQLGAYMKYTIAGETGLMAALRQGLVARVARAGHLHLNGEQSNRELTPAELPALGGQEIAGITCSYLGEPLAVVVLFRDAASPFTDQDLATLEAVAPLFAVALASMVKAQPDEAGDGPFADGLGGGRKADADDGEWWKRGEPPPY